VTRDRSTEHEGRISLAAVLAGTLLTVAKKK